jgi:predicted nuclease of predicted toxin-antitoxin system
LTSPRKIKFIADANIEKSIVDCLRANGCDVKWVAECAPAMIDSEILKIARREKRILITNDKDFGELVFLQKQLAAGVILFRIKGQQVSEKVRFAQILLENYGEKLAGHFVVIADKKIRFIELEA